MTNTREAAMARTLALAVLTLEEKYPDDRNSQATEAFAVGVALGVHAPGLAMDYIQLLNGLGLRINAALVDAMVTTIDAQDALLREEDER